MILKPQTLYRYFLSFVTKHIHVGACIEQPLQIGITCRKTVPRSRININQYRTVNSNTIKSPNNCSGAYINMSTKDLQAMYSVIN